MFDSARMLDFIERSLANDPFCTTCGAPTTVEDDDGLLWLICSAAMEPRTLVQRLSVAFRPHERHLIADLGQFVAA